MNVDPEQQVSNPLQLFQQQLKYSQSHKKEWTLRSILLLGIFVSYITGRIYHPYSVTTSLTLQVDSDLSNRIIGETSMCDIPDVSENPMEFSTTISKPFCLSTTPSKITKNALQLEKVIKEMKTEIQTKGYFGLSAIYVGVPIQIVVYENKIMKNPIITAHSPNKIKSIEYSAFRPTTKIVNERYEWVTIEYLTETNIVETKTYKNNRNAREIQMLIHSFSNPLLLI